MTKYNLHNKLNFNWTLKVSRIGHGLQYFIGFYKLFGAEVKRRKEDGK
jgi:hypothetical protein